MMKNKLLKSMLDELASQAIPAIEVNLWPKIIYNLESGDMRPYKGKLMKTVTQTNLTRRMAYALLVLITALTLFSFTPQGRVLAQNVWRFFRPVEGESRTVPTLDALLVTVPAAALEAPLPTFTPQPVVTEMPFQQACGSRLYPRCNLVEIQKMVDFPLRQPAFLPEGWEFAGATGGPQRISLIYRSPAGQLELAQQPAALPETTSWPVGNQANVENIPIGTTSGEYVQGAWSDPGQNAGVITWDAGIPEYILRWEENSIRYTLHYTPYKTNDGTRLDKNLLKKIAENLTHQLDDQALKPTGGYNNQASNDTDVTPGWLPERYSFDSAIQVPGRAAACTFFRYPASQGVPTLAIIESSQWISLDDILLPPQVYNGVAVEIPVYSEFVPLEGALNDQALYVSNGLQINSLCNALNLTTNHALLWHSGGKSYLISAMLNAFDGRGFLTRREMLRIAESINTPGLPAEASLDPEYLTSIQDAETLAGFDIQTPNQIPEEMRFAYAVLRNDPSAITLAPASNATPEVILAYYAATLDSLDRRHHILFFQQMAPENTLDEVALSGGEWVLVNGLPAVYSQSCYDNRAQGGDAACFIDLTWQDVAGIRFVLHAYLPALLDQNTLIVIAESTR